MPQQIQARNRDQRIQQHRVDIRRLTIRGIQSERQEPDGHMQSFAGELVLVDGLTPAAVQRDEAEGRGRAGEVAPVGAGGEIAVGLWSGAVWRGCRREVAGRWFLLLTAEAAGAERGVSGTRARTSTAGV